MLRKWWQSSPGPGEKLRPWAVSGGGGGRKEAAGTCTLPEGDLDAHEGGGGAGGAGVWTFPSHRSF